jgi:hypothetical protein
MAATAGHRLTLDPMGKMFQNASSLKPLGQLKPNCPGMIIGRSSTKLLFFVPVGYGSVSSLVSEKKTFEISANQSILLALAAILNIRLERKTVIL